MRTRGSRAEEIAGVDDANLGGKTAVVTGSTSGIGREIALALARLGANVHVHGRNPERGASVVEQVESTGVSGRFHRADFTDVDEIDELGRTLDAELSRVDILVHNAGAHFQRGRLTDFGLERTFQVNQFASFLLTEHLRPLSGNARVVVVASEIHRQDELDESFSAATRTDGYDGFDAYANSKLANVLYVNALAGRLDGAKANSCHPGFVPASGLWREASLPVQGVMALASRLPQAMVNRVVDTPVQAAATPVYLATSEEGGRRNGRYFVDCEEREPSELGRDAELAEALWSWSVAQLDRLDESGARQ